MTSEFYANSVLSNCRNELNDINDQFATSMDVEGDAVIGTDDQNTLLVRSVTTFNEDTTFSSNVLTNGIAPTTTATTATTNVISLRTNGGAINTTTVLTPSVSNTTYAITQTATAYAITLPTTNIAGLEFNFVVVAIGAANITIAGAGNTLYGNLLDTTPQQVAIAGDTTITLVGGASIVGSTIKLKGITDSYWLVNIIANDASGITLS